MKVTISNYVRLPINDLKLLIAEITTMRKRMKEDTKLKGLCKECTHRNSCEDAKRYLEMTACSNYRKWKKKVIKE